MNRFLLTLLTSVSCMLTFAQNSEPRNVSSTIQHVVVYMSGAELHHTATVRLTQGKQELVFNMEDQLPISSDKEIQITEEEISGGTLDKFNGKINYQIVLQPGETKKITLAYSVKSPQNRAIRGSRNVSRSRTKF